MINDRQPDHEHELDKRPFPEVEDDDMDLKIGDEDLIDIEPKPLPGGSPHIQ